MDICRECEPRAVGGPAAANKDLFSTILSERLHPSLLKLAGKHRFYWGSYLKYQKGNMLAGQIISWGLMVRQTPLLRRENPLTFSQTALTVRVPRLATRQGSLRVQSCTVKKR